MIIVVYTCKCGQSKLVQNNKMRRQYPLCSHCQEKINIPTDKKPADFNDAQIAGVFLVTPGGD